MSKWIEVCKNVHTFHYPIREMGLKYMSTMTVIKLSDGNLWVHSPADPSDDVQAYLNRLGDVKHVITPNNVHIDWSAKMKQTYPASFHYGSQDLQRLRPELKIDVPLSLNYQRSYNWNNEIHSQFIPSLPTLDEYLFLHEPSRSLIVTDLCFNWDARDINFLWKSFLIMSGRWRPLSPMKVFSDNVDDRQLMQEGLDRVLKWDFDSVLVCHTRPILYQGKQTFIDNLYHEMIR